MPVSQASSAILTHNSWEECWFLGLQLLQTVAGSCQEHSHACRNTKVSSVFSPAPEQQGGPLGLETFGLGL